VRWTRSGSIVVLMVLLTVIVGADFKESYRKGIQAIDRGSWAEAAQFMRQAIAEEPRESGTRVNISGGRWEPYIPHYYLGLALATLGNCADAVAEWKVSESQAVITKLGEYRTLTRRRDTCDGELRRAAAKAPGPPTPKPVPAAPVPAAPVSPSPPPANAAAVAQAVEDAQGSVRRADEALRALDAVVPGAASRQDAAIQKARSLLESARTAVETGRKTSDLAVLKQARDEAGQAAQMFDDLRTQTLAMRTEPQRPAAPDAGARAAGAPAAVPPPAAATAPPVASPALVRAAAAFFKGRYRDAVSAVDASGDQNGPAGVQSHLFRAAALYALYLVGGEKDGRLREDATGAVRNCRRLDPAFSPDPAVFSPRFVNFYRQVR
jgi:hypothetical protein